MKNRSNTSSNIKMLLCVPFFVFAILISLITILIQNDGVMRSYAFLLSSINMLSSVCDIVIYATSFAFIIYAVSERKSGIKPFLIFFAMAAVRYFVSAVIGGAIRGAVTRDDMISAAIVLGTDTLIIGILLIISYVIQKRAKNKPAPDEAVIKHRCLPDLSHTVNKCIFIAGAVWASIRLVSLIIYDVSFITIIGAPSAINIVWMIIYYIGAILICPIFYFISSYSVRLIRKSQDNSF